MPKSPKKPPTPVDAITHADAARPNLPTPELASLAPAGALDEDVRVAYARRNRDLDPQLVWRGKDAQDETELIAPAPPHLHRREDPSESAHRRPDALLPR